MTGSVTFSVGIGGDGSTVTDDDNATTGLRDGGWRTRFVPCFTNQVSIANYVVTQANAASASATAAGSSATSAAAAYDSFDDRYLGSKASDPSVDNDGNALLTGALYWNSTSSVMKVYSGSAWSAAYVPSSGYLALTGGTMTGAITFAAAQFGTNVNTFLSTPSSANLAAALTDETGSGSAVFNNTPTLITPILGTPQSGNLANCTFPTLNQSTTGTAANLTAATTLPSGITLVAPVLGTPSSGTLSSCTVDGTNGVGYINIPQNSQSAAYTLVAADAGKHIFHPSTDANARTFTIPANGSVAYPIGTELTVINQYGAGTITLTSADTLRLITTGSTGVTSVIAGNKADLIKVTSTEWLVSGATYVTPPPTTIGQAYGGGFYAGNINVSGTQYYLIVAPKATGEASGKTWGTYGATTGITSVINGPTNSASLAALGAAYQAAVFAEGLTIGGYSDWYLPAKNELEVLYYFLKPDTTANNTSSGSNDNAVSPEPISFNYTSGSPAQTSAGIGFRTGETDAFASDVYWSSTEVNSNGAWTQYFVTGYQGYPNKFSSYYVRAVRRIAV